jgi:prepilin-type processing-associated H-X9-DG protein
LPQGPGDYDEESWSRLADGALRRPGSLRYVSDGLSNTALVYEASGLPDLYWGDPRGLRSNRTPVVRGDPDYPQPSEGYAWRASWYAGSIQAATLAVGPRGVSSNGAAYRGNKINGTNLWGIYSFHQGTNMLFCDGSVRFLSEESDPDMVYAILTRDGGEIVDFSKF